MVACSVYRMGAKFCGRKFYRKDFMHIYVNNIKLQIVHCWKAQINENEPHESFYAINYVIRVLIL